MKLKLPWFFFSLLSVAVVIALFVKAREGRPTAPTRALSAPLSSHPLKGTVLSVETDDRLLLIDHEDIPGFMPAMAMFFRVDDATHRAARAGDRITATMVRHEESLVLQEVKLTPAPVAAPKAP